MSTVKILADKVKSFLFLFIAQNFQVLISNKLSKSKRFWELSDDDRDLTMFTKTNLTLAREGELKKQINLRHKFNQGWTN